MAYPRSTLFEVPTIPQCSNFLIGVLSSFAYNKTAFPFYKKKKGQSFSTGNVFLSKKLVEFEDAMPDDLHCITAELHAVVLNNHFLNSTFHLLLNVFFCIKMYF